MENKNDVSTNRLTNNYTQPFTNTVKPNKKEDFHENKNEALLNPLTHTTKIFPSNSVFEGQNIKQGEIKDRFELKLSNDLYIKLLSANEIMKQVEKIRNENNELLRTTNEMENTKNQNGNIEKKRESILLKISESYFEDLKVLLKHIDKETQAKSFESLTILSESLTNELKKVKEEKLSNCDRKWNQIESDIELQIEINEQIDLQNKRMENFAEAFEIDLNILQETVKSFQKNLINSELLISESQSSVSEELNKFAEKELERKIPELIQSNNLLENNLINLQKEKNELETKVNNFENWKTEILKTNSETSKNLQEIEILCDNEVDFEKTREIWQFSANKNSILMNIENELEKKLFEESNNELTCSKNIGVSLQNNNSDELLSKMSRMYQQQEKELADLENELKLLELEESDTQDLANVLQNLSYKFQKSTLKF